MPQNNDQPNAPSQPNQPETNGELTAIVADRMGKFVLSFAAELISENAGPNASENATGNPAENAGANNAPASDDGSFGGGAHGSVDFGTGAGAQLKLIVPTGQALTVITATLRKRSEQGEEASPGFGGGAHGSVDFGSGTTEEPLTIEFPVRLIFSNE